MATRRQLLIFGGGAALWVGAFRIGPDVASRLSGFEFAPVAEVPDFRTVSTTGASTPAGAGGFDFMAGLDPVEPLPPGLMDRVRAAPAEALFKGSRDSAAVRVAYFFDYYCPYCLVLSGYLSELVTSSEIDLTRHHWPLFGEASALAARASLAAEMQGKASALHQRLLQTPVRATPPYIEDLAKDLGLSWSALKQDMQALSVAAALEQTRALARLFRFFGTPALVIGRTIVQGEISEARLRHLIEIERTTK